MEGKYDGINRSKGVKTTENGSGRLARTIMTKTEWKWRKNWKKIDREVDVERYGSYRTVRMFCVRVISFRNISCRRSQTTNGLELTFLTEFWNNYLIIGYLGIELDGNRYTRGRGGRTEKNIDVDV